MRLGDFELSVGHSSKYVQEAVGYMDGTRDIHLSPGLLL